MKTSRLFIPILSLFALLANPVQADRGFVTITLQENGHGRIENEAGFSAALVGTLLSDPGPGGLSGGLTFDLLSPPGLVAGDVFLSEPYTGTSDVIRFNLAGTGDATYLASVVFYSLLNDSGQNQLADTGLPTANYANKVVIAENHNGPTSYTPTAGQPGYVAGASGLVNYLFFSAEPEGNAVPDAGSSIVLFASALFALGLFHTRTRARLQRLRLRRGVR